MLLTDSCIFEEIQAEVEALPDKLNFKIGEVARILGVETHVLRYWEEEFRLLKPKKFANKQRLYFKKDMEILFLIKILLYEEKLKAQGVRKYLSQFYYQFKKTYKQDKTSVNLKQKAAQKAVAKQEMTDILEGISDLRETINSNF